MFVAVNVVLVFAIVVPAVAKLSKEDSQRVMEPVCPLKVNTVELVPEQTVVPPEIDPPTDEFIVTANVVAVLVPQASVAVTDTEPEDEPAVAEIELVVELPDQPEGNVQL